MAKKKVDEPQLKLGDRVKIRYSGYGPRASSSCAVRWHREVGKFIGFACR
jgi:hypothetical protein